ncbi:MAG TPA: BamA/TamA family outer membrane protein [Balneolales bacterium]|nr:BamA/TamA family outer membrane protein [Balneolales bacterium]
MYNRKLAYSIFFTLSLTLGCFLRVSAQANGINARAPLVWDVNIRGNHAYPDMVLKDIIATQAPSFIQKLMFWKTPGTPFDKTEVEKDVIRIEHYYTRRGYPDIQVSYNIKSGHPAWKKTVTFTINEGVPLKVQSLSYAIKDPKKDSLRIVKSNSFQKALHQIPLRVGERYETIMEPNVTGRLVNVMNNLGYPYASVDLQPQIDSLAHKVHLHILLKPGTIGYITKINAEQVPAKDKHILIRQSGIRVGDRFSQKLLSDAQQAIFSHPLFNFVTVEIPDQPHDSTVTVDITAREHKPHTISIQAGFGTQEYLRGQVSWTNRNPFGGGNDFNATTRASFIEQRLTFSFHMPYIFNNKSSFITSPFASHQLEPGYELLQAGINNTLVYQATPYLTHTVTYEYTRNNIMQKQTNVTTFRDTTQLYNISSLQFSSIFQHNFGSSGNAWYINPYVEFSGLLGTGTYTYQKVSLAVNRLQQIGYDTDLVLRVNGGMIFHDENDTLPASIRFFAGGARSVRGWYRQQLGTKEPLLHSDGSFNKYLPYGGRVEFTFNIELRQGLQFIYRKLGMDVFLDGGQVWRRAKDVKFFDRHTFQSLIRQMNYNGLQFGAGMGLSYQTPIGPVRLDVGYKLNPTLSDLNYYNGVYHGSRGWNRIAFHLSIGNTF